jgi:hypothetical protein
MKLAHESRAERNWATDARLDEIAVQVIARDATRSGTVTSTREHRAPPRLTVRTTGLGSVEVWNVGDSIARSVRVAPASDGDVELFDLGVISPGAIAAGDTWQAGRVLGSRPNGPAELRLRWMDDEGNSFEEVDRAPLGRLPGL